MKFSIYMKKLCLTMMLLFMVIATYAGGIADAKQLMAFVNAVNAGDDITAFCNDEGVVCLEADIDLARIKKMPAIVTFEGVFDGNGFSLKNWKAQNGLFHEILDGGVVRNLIIDKSCSMKAQNKDGEFFLGWIADINNGTVENCENYGSLNHKSSYSGCNIFVGGLVGSNRYVVISCKNYGKISSRCSGSIGGNEVIHLGGIVGGCYNTIVPGATIARCQNFGEVSYNGDVPISRVAGIVGEAYKVSVKLCVNHGAVSSVANRTGKDPGTAFCSGITSFSQNDIVCCDNFGKVASSGNLKAVVSGIVATPHTRMVIADCHNHGEVEGANEQVNFIGGVAGNIGREVHLVNCSNARSGVVRFAGMCPNDASYVGGVVANAYSHKKAKFGVYMRRCNNFGLVESLRGGNSYGNNDKAIHTGGLIGQAKGTESKPIRILDCANKGLVKADSGRRGSIAGIAKFTDISGGFFDNNYAEPASPLSDGKNIFGRVTDTHGNPVAGCVVSDGRQCVETDGYGNYAMASDLADTRFVFISLPDGYKFTHRKSIIQNFCRIPRYCSGAMANFTIEKQTTPMDKYTVVMIGDPQMRGLGHDGSGERFRDVVLPDIENFKEGCAGELFAINLGDLVYNWMAGYDDYLDISSTASYPMCNLIGNHDYDQNTILDGRLGTPYFEEYMTPTYYSFTIGKIHYIILNSIEYSRRDSREHYKSGLDDKQMEWLENDLAFVPKDYTLYICGHAQLWKKPGKDSEERHGRLNKNYERYTELLSQYKQIYSWSGHYHINYGYKYNNKESYEQLNDVQCVSVGRCVGTLRTNKELDNAGITNGYMVVNVDGEELNWYYKTVGHDSLHQMRVYSPTVTQDGYVKACIWNHSTDYWSVPEWWENGVKVADLESHAEPDPAYLDIYESVKHLTGIAGDYARPAKSRYMFRVKPTSGVRAGEIRVTDNFGRTYIEKIEW